jgi:NADH-quinone oxidoreductase subunit N
MATYMTQLLLKQLQDGLGRDGMAFLPELVLCGTIVLMLLLRLFPRFDEKHLGWVALVLTGYALFISWQQWTGGDKSVDPRVNAGVPGAPVLSLNLFSGMLVFDNFTIFLRLFLFSFTFLVILLTLMTGIPDKEDSADFYCLLLGSVIGMSVMASANHLLMVLLGVEMASLPSYAMAGFLKGRRQSSEAALKYVVYGGGAAGVMLYGISLLAGRFGTAYLPQLVVEINKHGIDPLVLLGSLFILIGVCFKLAAVPFHFWCPDVFEGAAAEVAAFLSVASKGAALALLARLVLGLGGLGAIQPDPDMWAKAVPYLVPILAILAAVTATFGNLAAYMQTNLKRLLAYSTIAHAGYMMMALTTCTREGAGAMLFYLIVYLFMNLGAFAAVAVLRNLTLSEDLADFRGMVYRNPLVVICLAVFLLSLLGMPPLGGFAAKFQVFSVLFDGAKEFASQGRPGLSYTMYALVVIGGLNTAISLFYYAKVLKVMILEQPLEAVENRPIAQLPTPAIANGFLGLLTAAILVTGLFWNPLSLGSQEGVNSFSSPKAANVVAQRPAEGAPR